MIPNLIEYVAERMKEDAAVLKKHRKGRKKRLLFAEAAKNKQGRLRQAGRGQGNLALRASN